MSLLLLFLSNNQFYILFRFTATAAAIGSVGGVLLVISGFVGYKFYQRRRRINEATERSVNFTNNRSTRRSNDSGSSHGSGTVIVTADANYNAVNNNE